MGRRHLSLALAALMFLPLLTSATTGEAKKENLEVDRNLSIAKMLITIRQEANQKELVIANDEEVKTKDETKKTQRPHISEIPLDDKLLDYIWNKAQKYNFSYEMLLAIAKTESDFNVNTESSTRDSGLFQINRATGKWIAEELGLSKYDLSNPYTSTDFAVYYLTTLREAWDNKGLSEEELFEAIVISYNRGVSGANKYIKKHGTKNNTYLNKINKYKKMYEMGD